MGYAKFMGRILFFANCLFFGGDNAIIEELYHGESIMPHYDQNWEDLGKSIQDAVDRAINSRDYQKLNQTVRQTIDRAVDAGGEAVRKAMSGSARKNETRYQAPARPVVPARKVSALYGSTTGKMVGGILKITSGSMLSPFAFLVLLGGALIECAYCC